MNLLKSTRHSAKKNEDIDLIFQYTMFELQLDFLYSLKKIITGLSINFDDI